VLKNIVVNVAVVAVTVALGWFTWRLRRVSNPFAKWGGMVVGAFFTLILTVLSVAGTRGMFQLYLPRGSAPRDLKVDMSTERVERGKHIANTMCAGCHTMNGQLPLSGGKNLSDEAGIPLGDLYTINLTPAGPLKDWTDGEIFRAVRQGADKNGRRLPVMSSQAARNLSDADLESVVAYLRSQPAVENPTPPVNPSFLLAIMSGAGMVPAQPGILTEPVSAPTPGPTLAYGKYSVGWMGCEECHGPNLTGGGGGVVPVGPNLRSVKGWSRDGFLAAMRTGKTPFGKQLDSLLMPWNFVGRATDDELTAIYTYLVSLPD
jgi:mono/diheme cytochrome c family protein